MTVLVVLGILQTLCMVGLLVREAFLWRRQITYYQIWREQDRADQFRNAPNTSLTSSRKRVPHDDIYQG